MGYLGTKPSSGFITTAKQRVTSSTNNYVDLDNAISSLSDVIVWVNSVKQDSTNLTLTTSTRITLGGTLTASDVVEIAYLGKAVATQTPDTGTVTNDMLAGSIANSKLANSSITLNGSAVSLGGSATTTIETPYAARIYKAANQFIPNNTLTLLDFASGTTEFSKGSISDLATAKITVPTGADGFWCFYVYLRVNNYRANRNVINIYKNGTTTSGGSTGDAFDMGYWGASGQYSSVGGTLLMNLSAGDYIQPYFLQDSGGSDAIFERSFTGWYLGSAT